MSLFHGVVRLAIVTRKNVQRNAVLANRILSALPDYCPAKIYDISERTIPETNLLIVDSLHQSSLASLSRFLPEKNIVFYAFCEGFPNIDPQCVEREIAEQIKIVPVSGYTKLMLETMQLRAEKRVYPGLNMNCTDLDLPYAKWAKGKWGPTALYVADNTPRKGLEPYMIACKIVSERLKKLNPGFILHSRSGSTDIRRTMQSLEIKNFWYTSSYGLLDELKLNSLYSICDVYVQSSLCESFGLPMIEAYRFLKPVIAVYAQPYQEIVTDQKTGCLIPIINVNQVIDDQYAFELHHYSAEALADAMENALSGSLGDTSGAIREVREKFTLTNFRALIDFFS